MNTADLKKIVERKGVAYATLFNGYGEKLFLGNVQTMNNRKGRLHMAWALAAASHLSPFTTYMIHDDSRVLYTDNIVPLRADIGIKKFEVELDG